MRSNKVAVVHHHVPFFANAFTDSLHDIEVFPILVSLSLLLASVSKHVEILFHLLNVELGLLFLFLSGLFRGFLFSFFFRGFLFRGVLFMGFVLKDFLLRDFLLRD